MAYCEKHKRPYGINEVPGHPGKTVEVCFACEAEKREDFMKDFLITKPVISDAHMRRIHMSAMNPNPANCADAVRVCEALDLDIDEMKRSGVKAISWELAVKLVDKRDKALSDNATLRTALREAADAIDKANKDLLAWGCYVPKSRTKVGGAFDKDMEHNEQAAAKARLAAGGEASGS